MLRSFSSLAWRNLTEHKLRSLLTRLAISLGVGMVLAAAIVGQAAGRQVDQLSSQGVMGNTLFVQAGLAMVGALLLFAACFIILNAFGMSLAQRMHDIGTLRALGATHHQVRRIILAEAALLGLAGAAGGIAVGVGLGWGVMQAMGTLKDAPLQVPWWGLVFSPTVGLAVTVAGALQPAWHAGRVAPITAIRPVTALTSGRRATWQRAGRWGAALIAMAMIGAVALGALARPDVLTAQAAALVTQALLLVGAVLSLPALIEPLAMLCRPLLVRWLGIEGHMAADNLQRNKLRAALTTGAMAAGLVAIIATSGMMTAGAKGSLRRFGTMLREDFFVVHDLPQLVASGELSVENFFQFIAAGDRRLELNAAVAAMEPLVKSGAIQIERYRFVPIPPELAAVPGSPAIAVDPEPFLQMGNFDFHQGDPGIALAWMQRGRALLLQPMVAEHLGVGVGDAVSVQTLQGPIEFTVAGIGGSGWNMTVIPYADAEEYLGATGPTHVGVLVQDGASIEAAMAQVQQVITPFPGVIVYHYDNYFDPLADMVHRLELLLDGLLMLAVIIGALGMVNATVVNVAERRREIGLLRAVGATRAQVRRSVVAEAALSGLIAALAAGGLGLLMLVVWVALILPNGTASVGVRSDWTTVQIVVLPALRDLLLAWAVALIGAPLVAGLAAYLPARTAAGMSVVEATRYE